MGAWGSEIFDTDSACDLRDDWEALAAESLSPDQISEQLMAAYGNGYKPLDIDPELIYALVSLQIDACYLDRLALAEAVSMIDGKIGLDTWDDPDERQAELLKLKDKIETFEGDHIEQLGRVKVSEPDQILY